ncbi:MAG: WD40 repeat domain-containing protein [Lysobacteraceae bacterium]
MTASAPLLWQKTPEPGHFINSVACSADGTQVIAGTFLHTYPKSDSSATTFAKRRGKVADADPSATTDSFHTYCWDYEGNLRWSVESSSYEGVYWVAMSGNGAVAASGGWYSQSPLNGYVAAYDASNGAPLMPTYLTDSRVNQVALSNDGKLLAAASNKLHLFINTGSGFPNTPWEWTPPPVSGDDVNVIACGVSADGQYVCAGTSSGKVILFRIANGVVTQTSPMWPATDDTGSIVHSLAMATNGAGFAAGMSAGQFGYFDCADFISSGNIKWSDTLPGVGAVYGVGIAGDASVVSVVGNTGDTGTVAAYANTASGGTKQWQQNLPANPNETSIDGRGLWVATADGHPDGTPGHFTLFNAGSGDQVWQFTTGNMSWPIQLSENGRVCVAGSDDGSVYFFAPLLLGDSD